MGSISNILHSRSDKDGNFFSALQNLIGFKPKELAHYREAFIHRSFNKKDSHGNEVNYERLEFLGDAMLGAVIAGYLYTQAPHGDEGYLTKMRSKIVSRKHLNELGKDLNLIDFIESTHSKTNFGPNIHGNLFEALIGAIYLDRNFKYCKKFIHSRVIGPYVDIEQLEGKIISHKSLLIEWCQKEKKEFDFKVYEDTGKGEEKHFAVKLRIDGKVVAKARETSKKKAEEKASRRAYYAYQNDIDNNRNHA